MLDESMGSSCEDEQEAAGQAEECAPTSPSSDSLLGTSGFSQADSRSTSMAVLSSAVCLLGAPAWEVWARCILRSEHVKWRLGAEGRDRTEAGETHGHADPGRAAGGKGGSDGGRGAGRGPLLQPVGGYARRASQGGTRGSLTLHRLLDSRSPWTSFLTSVPMQGFVALSRYWKLVLASGPSRMVAAASHAMSAASAVLEVPTHLQEGMGGRAELRWASREGEGPRGWYLSRACAAAAVPHLLAVPSLISTALTIFLPCAAGLRAFLLLGFSMPPWLSLVSAADLHFFWEGAFLPLGKRPGATVGAACVGTECRVMRCSRLRALPSAPMPRPHRDWVHA